MTNLRIKFEYLNKNFEKYFNKIFKNYVNKIFKKYLNKNLKNIEQIFELLRVLPEVMEVVQEDAPFPSEAQQ